MSRQSKVLIESYSAKVRVDREAGIIHDALLLGPTSRNGVEYPSSVREAAVPLFESIHACLSHPAERTKDEVRRPRRWEERVGKYANVRNTDTGLRGDIHIKKSHPYANLLLDEAESNPNDFGLSPVMLGKTRPDGKGKEVCVSIDVVRTVDIVLEPATTRGLFEEEEEEEPDATAEEAYEEACLKAVVEAAHKALQGEITPAEAAKMVKDHLQRHLKMHGKDEEETPEEATAEEDEATAEEEPAEMKEHRLLRLEKECRVLCEEMRINPNQELLNLLVDLPSAEKRREHLKWVRRMLPVKKVGSKKEPVKQESGGNPNNYTSILRS